MTTNAKAPSTRLDRSWVPTARLIASLAAVLATIPYLTLKTLWLTGSEVGVTDRAFIHDPTVSALNLVTAGMDGVAVVVAFAFIARWGMRVPAWLIVLPAWIAGGLLGPIALTTPLSYALSTGGSGDLGGLPLESWVRPMVYGGFTVQGVALITGFVFYAVSRWGHLMRGTLVAAAPTPERRMRRQLAGGAAGLGLVAGTVSLAWAWGAPWGLPDAFTDTRTALSVAVGTVKALFTFAAVAGVLALVLRRPAGTPYWIPAVAAWFGSAAMFSWGLWGLVNVLGSTALTSDATGMAPSNLHALAQTFAGLVLALVALAEMVARDGGRSTPISGGTPSAGRAAPAAASAGSGPRS